MIYLDGQSTKLFGNIERAVVDEITESTEIYRTMANACFYVYGAGVQGDVAEFGTMSGRSAVAIAVAVAYLNDQYQNDPRGVKRAHFFDSFTGLPEATSEIDLNSPHVESGIWGAGSCKVLGEEQLTALISKYLHPEQYDVYPGWFADTVPLLDAKLALLHVDGDLYQSAIDVLDTLFARQRVSEGAMVLFDDWNCNAASPHCGERRAWGEIVERYKITASNAGSYGWGGQRFIVHGYRCP